MVRDLRFRLLIDNSQFLAAAAQAGQGIAGMGRQIVDGGRSASGALDGITDAARRLGPGVQQGTAAATQGLRQTAGTAATAAQALQQTAAAGDTIGRGLAQGATQGAQALQQTATAAQAVAQSAGRMREETGRFTSTATQAGQAGAQALQQTAAGAERATGAITGTERAARATAVSLREIAGGALAFGAVTAAANQAVDAVGKIPKDGIKFAMDVEVSQLGMAGVFSSILEVDGKAIQFDQSMQLAEGSIRRLQKAAAETASSSGELIDTFQAMVGPALAAGMTIEQVERAVVVGVNAVKTQGLAGAQIKQELRDIIGGGDITAASSIATMLGITDADIAKAKASAEGLFGFVMQRMSGFEQSADRYKGTLRGALDGLQEEVTQASAKAMAPAVDAAKDAVQQISDALDTAGSRNALAGVGEGIATTIGVMTSGIGVAQQYGGAIMAVAGAYAAIKVGTVASSFAQVASAKMASADASRLAAVQAVLAAEADDKATMSTRARMAAILAEERAKVQALATETALTAAKLRAAEAQAAQLTGLQRLAAVESQVMPLRQQHAAQTGALEQAQQRLTTATNAASMASRAMGAVVGALGGPIGIAITAVTLLAGSLISARQEAEKLGKTKLSVERVEETLAKGGKVDDKDAGRVRSALDEAKEKRDGLLAETRRPASMADRSKGLLGGDSTVEKRAKELAQAETEVKRLEMLAGKIDKAQELAAGTLSQSVNLAAGTSGKALSQTTDKLQTRDGIIEAGQQRLQTLERQAAQERALMIKRNASAADLATFDKMVADKQTASQRETTLDLQKLHKAENKASGGEFGGGRGADQAAQLEKAQADLSLANLKRTSAERVAALDDELQRVEALHQQGLTGVEEYEADRLRISQDKRAERLKLIDEEIAAEGRRRPANPVETVRREQRVTELTTERNSVTAEIKGATTAAAAGVAQRDLERQRQIATENVQVWQDAQQRIQQLRQQNGTAAMALVTDPAVKARMEVEAQIQEIRRAADEMGSKLDLRLSLTTDPGQRKLIVDQMAAVADESARAIELANEGLAQRLKPGWQQMLEGWRDTTRLMREANDQAMSGLLSKAEDTFVNFRKTGKINIKGLVSDWVDAQMKMQFRQFMGGEQGTAITGFLRGIMPGGGGKAPGTELAAGAAGPVMPADVGASRALEGLKSAGTAAAAALDSAGDAGGGLAKGLGGVIGQLGNFGGSLMSTLSSLMSSVGGGSAAGGGGGLWQTLGSALGSWLGGGATPNALGGIYTGAERFAAGGSFAAGGQLANQIIDRDTYFRFKAAGRERLGLLGEAGPEAIMPLSGGGALAIDATGRRVGNLPVQRGPGGRLSVVVQGLASALAPDARQRTATMAGGVSTTSGPGSMSRFAAGAVFGRQDMQAAAGAGLSAGATGQLKAAATTAGTSSKAGDLAIDASTTLNVMDMTKVQAMVSQACAGVERRIYEHLRAVGAMR